MNLATVAAAAMRLVPGSVQGAITFTNRTTRETATSTGVFVPAGGSPNDTFEERETVRSKSRRGVVAAAPLAFAPAAGMTARWEGGTWSVAAASPLDPAGAGVPLQYRVALTR